MKSHPVTNAVSVIAVLFVVVSVPASPCGAQQVGSMEPAAKQIQPLSRSALEALVAPYALYSDAVVERVLDAAQSDGSPRSGTVGIVGKSGQQLA